MEHVVDVEGCAEGAVGLARGYETVGGGAAETGRAREEGEKVVWVDCVEV